MKLLGFHFDSRPNIDAHVAAVLKKVRYCTWSIYNLKRLGLSSVSLIGVYKLLVRWDLVAHPVTQVIGEQALVDILDLSEVA